jgi:nucleotide-binding universal stress UspA family protein
MAAPILLSQATPILKNVLFTTDFSPASLAALPFAGTVARSFDSNLHLCHIEPPAPLSGALADPHLYETAGKNAANQLAAIRNRPELNGLKTAPLLILEEGNFKEEVQKIVSRSKIDLVVAGTKGRTGLSKMLLGSTTEEICRAVTCPILTVGPGIGLGVTKPFQRILFPTNLSELSHKTVPYIALLARQFSAHIMVLHVLPQNEATASGEKSLAEAARAAMNREFADLASFEPEIIVGFGDTADTVLRVGREKNASLIAMGIRNAFRPGVLRERTAYRVIAGAQCPVLTVR